MLGKGSLMALNATCEDIFDNSRAGEDKKDSLFTENGGHKL